MVCSRRRPSSTTTAVIPGLSRSIRIRDVNDGLVTDDRGGSRPVEKPWTWGASPARVAAVAIGCSRTCVSVPWNVSSGYDSTSKVTASPGVSPPTSDSSMPTWTCSRVRSVAIRNKTGDWTEAASV